MVCLAFFFIGVSGISMVSYGDKRLSVNEFTKQKTEIQAELLEITFSDKCFLLIACRNCRLTA